MSLKSTLLFVISFTCVFLVSSLNCSFGQNAPKQLLLALSKTDHTLAIVDPNSLKVIVRLSVGQDPHEVIASSDGSMAYVSNMGGGRFHELNIIDINGQKPLPAFDSYPLIGLHGLDYKGDKLWFTAEGAKSIGRYDPKTGKTDWIMGTGHDRTHMIYVTSDEKHIYTTNVASGTVSIFENAAINQQGPPPPTSGSGNSPAPPPQRMDWEQTIIPVDRGSEGFDVLPNGKELWTAASETGNISVIDLASKKRIATIDANVMGANRLKFTIDGKLALITSLRSGDLVIYDVQLRKEIKRIPIGHGAAGIVMDPSGSRAFVACTPDNYIAIIDLKTLSVTNHLDVGGGPDGLAWVVNK
ncbi:MAG: YncE family protein [Flavisolibacter sp.]